MYIHVSNYTSAGGRERVDFRVFKHWPGQTQRLGLVILLSLSLRAGPEVCANNNSSGARAPTRFVNHYVCNVCTPPPPNPLPQSTLGTPTRLQCRWQLFEHVRIEKIIYLFIEFKMRFYDCEVAFRN